MENEWKVVFIVENSHTDRQTDSTLKTVPPECNRPKVKTHSLTIMFIFLVETTSYPLQRMGLMEQPLSCHPKL